MDTQSKPQSALFEVYLRLRPPPAPNGLYPTLTAPERFLAVEETEDGESTHITLNPPNDNRRRAVEKFAFTKVFEEEASQLDLFNGTGVIPLVEGVLGAKGGDGRDGLLATLGVTGSGKSHTILGSRNQRGLTQLALDLLFRSISRNILDPSTTHSLHNSIAASDPSESQVLSAQGFFDILYGDPTANSRANSRAATPMRVDSPFTYRPSSINLYPSLLGLSTNSPKSIRTIWEESPLTSPVVVPPKVPLYMTATLKSTKNKFYTKSALKGESVPPPTPRRNMPYRPANIPTNPDISDVTVDVDDNAEYAIVISMYEVYNDRIFDLLTPASRVPSTKEIRRRPLLFKPTEASPDRKVVAGLRKVICGSVKEALMVLDAGLHERRVAGTGSNSVSSRSHGFFCVEVKKRRRGFRAWSRSALTIVDLAGSERARDARTQGATLAEAGKINESLMYLGQCLQMQSDAGSNSKPNIVPYRQCKLTELLFSNSFPTASSSSSTPTRPQRATMIVTADPVGDFNATSQILRYSALAREVTVPRIPSITATILSQSTASYGSHTSSFGNHARRPYSPSDERATMELAALEIARLSDEIDMLRDELAIERAAREEAEAHVVSSEERILDMEMQVREEVWTEMEKRMEQDRRGWMARWEEERERGGEWVDRKLEVLVRGLDLDDEKDGNKENIPAANCNAGENEKADLEEENCQLKAMVKRMQREAGQKSPSKLREVRRPLESTGPSLSFGIPSLENLRAGGVARGSTGASTVLREREVVREKESADRVSSSVKKVKKMTARKWDLMNEDEML